MSNEIECNDLDDFVDVIEKLTIKGIKFEASTGTLTITITGY
jgi:hypothetical protein